MAPTMLTLTPITALPLPAPLPAAPAAVVTAAAAAVSPSFPATALAEPRPGPRPRPVGRLAALLSCTRPLAPEPAVREPETKGSAPGTGSRSIHAAARILLSADPPANNT